MMNWLRRDISGSDEPGRDMVVAEALESLDPASHDPNYWFRFHGRVMAGAESELARRRMLANLTVTDLMASWSRTVVPTAMLAAAVAALLLIRSGTGSFQHAVGVEEFLLTDIPTESVPAMLETDAPMSATIFTSDIF
jgi:hypothetical protein